MTRFPDFEHRLINWARSQLGRPFVWGETNCMALVLAAFDVQTSGALLDDYRPLMATEEAARAYSQTHGLRGALRTLKGRGLVVRAPSFARVGDAALLELDGWISGHVLLPGGKLLSSTRDNGVVIVQHICAPELMIGVP